MKLFRTNKFKVGDKVRMTKAFKKRMFGKCKPNCHIDPLMTSENNCLWCSIDHILEFGNCTGTVKGYVKYPGQYGPELNVRWDIYKTGLVYCYHPNDLEAI